MAKLTAKAKQQTLFQIWIAGANRAYDVLESEMLAAVARMRAMGLSDRTIFRTLTEQLTNGTDVFQAFKGKMSKEHERVQNLTAQNEITSVYEDTDTKLIWQLDPTAKEHCADCLARSSEDAKTYAEWEELGLPAAGSTECGEYCKCILVEV